MGASAAVAVMIRKERELVEHFRRAGATSLSSAKSSSDLGVDEGGAWRRLVARGVLREAEEGTYYLDETSWAALGSMRRRVALTMTILVVALGVAVMMWTRVIAQR